MEVKYNSSGSLFPLKRLLTDRNNPLSKLFGMGSAKNSKSIDFIPPLKNVLTTRNSMKNFLQKDEEEAFSDI